MFNGTEYTSGNVTRTGRAMDHEEAFLYSLGVTMYNARPKPPESPSLNHDARRKLKLEARRRRKYAPN